MGAASASSLSTGSLVLGLVALALAGATTFVSLQLVDERSHSDELRARIAELEDAQQRDERRFRQLRALAAARPPPVLEVGPPVETRSPLPPGRKPDSANDAAAASEPAASVSVGPRAAFRSGFDPMRDPQAREQMRRQQLAALRRIYPDLARELQLSPEEAERFLAATVDQQMRMMDENRQLASSGLAPGSGEMLEMRRRMQQLQRDGESQLETQFGGETIQRWKAYQESMPARMTVRELQVDLVDAGTPLSSDQRQQLVAAMVKEQRAAAAATRPGSTAFIDPVSGGVSAIRTAANAGPPSPDAVAVRMQASLQRAEESYARLRASASTILSPEQFARFDQVQRDRLEMMRSSAQAARARAASAEGSSPGSAAAGSMTPLAPGARAP